ncbi:divergent polysaccharide deacetylase family protein [Neptunicoccus sediminis]|uniref:divergent polysaccharide deacetylase family protein n=1 Tax=Neptunicoccus sediminis TaxID=1892596 RepID=UPI00084603C1|nr:divergent polysaccharide deacetylase family protein [Neptunicoccus sediminis]
MANWGKTAGVVSGLAVGLTSGVFLAALNPILPETDRTTVSNAPEQATGSPATPTAQPDGTSAGAVVSQNTSGVNQSPTLDMTKTAASTAAPAPDQSPNGVIVSGSQDSAPSSVNAARQRPQNTEVAVLTTETQVPAETELSITMPVVADTPETAGLARITPEDGAENQPTVSSDPADPVEMGQPLVETAGPDALVGETDDNDNDLPLLNPDGTIERADTRDSRRIGVLDQTAIVLPRLDKEPGKAPAPEPAAEDTQDPLRILPVVPVPEDKAGSDEPQSDDDTLRSAAFSPDNQPNTSGTFATLGSRLPTIGDKGADGISTLGKSAISKRIPTIGEDEPVLSGQIATPAVGALRANANEFTPTGKPLVSVVLLDNGQIEGQLSKFARLGLPLAIAIPVDQPDVPAKSRAYRNAGFEVLALSPRDVKLSLPGGQTDEQVAELLERFFSLMPDAMGLIDRPAALLQRDQRLVRSVVGYFAQTGHGIITYAGGLNAAPRLADQQDVAFGVVSHILDGSEDTETVLSGYLNRAARTARSKGSAIVLAMPNDETLSALLNWSLGINARTVSFAPVSAALMAGNP